MTSKVNVKHISTKPAILSICSTNISITNLNNSGSSVITHYHVDQQQSRTKPTISPVTHCPQLKPHRKVIGEVQLAALHYRRAQCYCYGYALTDAPLLDSIHEPSSLIEQA